jgi:hypothetical protein
MKAELNSINSSNISSINHNNYLRRAWWWYIFCYFERNVPHDLPHKFSWPVPKKIENSRPIQYIKRKFDRNAIDSSLDESRSNLLSSNNVTGYSTIHNSTAQNDGN